jgi:hypothetical protein
MHHLYVRDERNLHLLPEEVLNRATSRFLDGITDLAIPDLLFYLTFTTRTISTQLAAAAAAALSGSGSEGKSGGAPTSTSVASPLGPQAPYNLLPVEPLVMLMEVGGYTLLLGLNRPLITSAKHLSVPRAYLPSDVPDLLLSLPMWGLSVNKYAVHEQMSYWLTTVPQGATHRMMQDLITCVGRVAALLAEGAASNANSSILATTAAHQMVAAVLRTPGGGSGGAGGGTGGDHSEGVVSGGSVTPLLSPPMQRLRAGLLAHRLARLLACVLMTSEVGNAGVAASAGGGNAQAAQFSTLDSGRLREVRGLEGPCSLSRTWATLKRLSTRLVVN